MANVPAAAENAAEGAEGGEGGGGAEAAEDEAVEKDDEDEDEDDEEEAEAEAEAKPTKAEVVEEEEQEKENAVTDMIILLPDGGWAWVVVACAFMCMLIIDGVVFTYGILIDEILEYFNTSFFEAALISAVQIALYYMCSPLASALIHRIGIKATTMAGSCICSLGVLLSYFCERYITFFLCYAVVGGLGSALINMPCMMIPEFYFKKYRAATQAITLAGSSFGVMIFSAVYLVLEEMDSWQTVLLVKSSLLALVYFFAYTFHSLRMLSKEGDHWEAKGGKQKAGHVKKAEKQATKATAGLSEQAAKELSGKGDAKKAVVKQVTATALVPCGVGPRQLARIASTLSNTSYKRKKRNRVIIYAETTTKIADLDDEEVKEIVEPQKEEEEKDETNQDKLKDGKEPESNHDKLKVVETKIEKIENYIEVKGKIVKKGTKKVIANVLDASLLKVPSFICLIICSIFSSFGILIPYTYLPSRNRGYGFDEFHCEMFLGVIGFANAIGRLIIGGAQLGSKWDPTLIYSVTLGLAGVVTLLSDMYNDSLFQYGYAVAFGFFVSGQSAVRSDCVVKLYGLEKLTHAMGILYLGLGIGSFTGQTTSGELVDSYGYKPPFILAGISMLAAAVTMIAVRILSAGESQQTEVVGEEDLEEAKPK